MQLLKDRFRKRTACIRSTTATTTQKLLNRHFLVFCGQFVPFRTSGCLQVGLASQTRRSVVWLVSSPAHFRLPFCNGPESGSLVPSPPLLLTKWPQKKWSGIFGLIPWFSPFQIILANQIAAWSRVCQKPRTNLVCEAE